MLKYCGVLVLTIILVISSAGCTGMGNNNVKTNEYQARSVKQSQAQNQEQVRKYATSSQPPIAGSGPLAGGAPNARSKPATGGASGTVDSVSTSSFTMTTLAAQKVTVTEVSSTKYKKGTSSTVASAITTGDRVIVLGTTSVLGSASGATITATQVIVQPTEVGKIPANYTEGSGTIVSGTTANKATLVALAAYPGGVVDRVVKLSNGEYEVHNITVKWPHHIFVNKHFNVVGAN
jgi:hypothetical protein